ncbi:RVP domain-containing protein [Trichonephila clavipes]|nr:RVP domain-containing protein [Trichonephila clavipes]
MAYLGKGRLEDLFVLATELNLKFDKSMTIATLKDLIISSEDYDEELTKNIHSTIVEDRKAREQNLRIEEQKEKLRIEEQKEKLRIEEQKEKLRIEEREEKLRFVQLSRRIREDFKRTLKQKSSSPFVKKQEFRFTEKNRRYEAPGKFEYNRKDKKFPASTNYNKHYEAPVTKYESIHKYQDSAQKGYYNKNYEKHSNHNASKHMLRRTIQNRRNSKNLQKKTCTLIVKEGLRTKEIFFGKVKITALIDSGSTVSLLRENTSRRIMDPTKLSKNKMLLTGIGEAQVTTIGSFEHKFKIDDGNYSLTWHVVPTDKLKFEAVIGSDLLEQASISFTKEGVKFNKYENHAQLMQISAENLQEELDLRHVENRQIKKELEKLIQDYKPEKQHLLTSQ